jgi:glyoxylase-like metal-dependent hydrolase (beta-lactamase superfamily II)
MKKGKTVAYETSIMQKPVAEFWYAIDCFDDGVVRLSEAWLDPFFGSNIWLIRGSDRDVLIDTGTGIVSPRRILDGIVDRPLLALSCNCFCDHAGGLHNFDERGCHRLDAERIANPTVASSLSVYVSNDALMAVPYDGYEIATYRLRGAVPTVAFNDGDCIDLGDRRLEVLHLPGVTPGSVVLWEARTGSLFTSDTLYDDPMAERHCYAADPITYARSLNRLRELPVRTVYGGHFRPFGRGRMLEIIDQNQRRGAVRLQLES